MGDGGGVMARHAMLIDLAGRCKAGRDADVPGAKPYSLAILRQLIETHTT
jgi:hypothetical protein